MSARRPDTPVCVCGHAVTGHARTGRGYYIRFGMCQRTNGRRGWQWRPCPCLRFHDREVS